MQGAGGARVAGAGGGGGRAHRGAGRSGGVLQPGRALAVEERARQGGGRGALGRAGVQHRPGRVPVGGGQDAGHHGAAGPVPPVVRLLRAQAPRGAGHGERRAGAHRGGACVLQPGAPRQRGRRRAGPRAAHALAAVAARGRGRGGARGAAAQRGQRHGAHRLRVPVAAAQRAAGAGVPGRAGQGGGLPHAAQAVIPFLLPGAMCWTAGSAGLMVLRQRGGGRQLQVQLLPAWQGQECRHASGIVMAVWLMGC
mmetsp:Transcript_3597/g.8974  ORF Transcript_3597/g.8974 Transcript_3597/m.8974 type:complete len:253 (-) Transcript_3597:121-879(-)